MRFLVAPDKFKGSLDGRGVAESIATGLREILPDAEIDIVPMADGGEGTAQAIYQACGGQWITCDVHDALGRAIQARYVWLGDSAKAIMEMSETAGLWRIAVEERNPLYANTAGVGEMLLDAVGRKAKEIVIGLGGSATNDGGFGLARSVGYRFLDQQGVELTNGPMDLMKLAEIKRGDVGTLVPSTGLQGGRMAQAPLHLPRIIAATDVRNPLLGESGATRTFGRQKGAASEQLELLEECLTRLADLVARDLRIDLREVLGSGAAGGLGFGLISFCGATVRPGFEVVADAVDLEAKMKKVDVVITGEGSLDRQTLNGKTPAGVARLARRLGKRVFASVGRADEDRPVREVFDGVLELGGNIGQTRERLRERARELAISLKQKVNT